MRISVAMRIQVAIVGTPVPGPVQGEHMITHLISSAVAPHWVGAFRLGSIGDSGDTLNKLPSLGLICD